MSWLRKWAGAVATLVTALVAVFLISSGSRHQRRQEVLQAKADRLERDMDVSVEDYNAAKSRAEAADHRAKAAVKEAEARIDEIKKVDQTLATRVDRYRRRRLQRRGS